MGDKENSAADGRNGDAEDSKPLNENPEVKIVPKKNETKLDLESDAAARKMALGLTKEELMLYASDPFWVRLRWGLFVLFWLAWTAMLVASVVIIIYAPKCPSPEPRQWWQKGPIYKVDVKTFKDSNGDGVGDLEGVKQEMNYLVETGATAVHLSNFISNSQAPGAGVGVLDYKDVDSSVGSKENLIKLITELKERQLKVIVDFYPNQVSVDHEWFKKSVDRDGEFADFFVWKAGSPSNPPNNYQSKSGGSGWSYNEARGEWYLHNFDSSTSDLNLNNPKVVDALKEVMSYWLDQGVDGFNVMSVDLLVENFDSGMGDVAASSEVVAQLRQVVDKAAEDSGEVKILMATSDLNLEEVGTFYGDIAETSIGNIIQLPLAEDSLLGSTPIQNADELKVAIEKYSVELPAFAWPAMGVTSSQMAQGARMTEILSLLTFLLPGTPIISAGQELGLSGESFDLSKAEAMLADTQVDSTNQLQNLRLMAGLRHDEAILRGQLSIVVVNSTLVVSRVKKGYPGYMIVVNLDPTAAKTLDLAAVDSVSEKVTLLTRSSGPDGTITFPEEKRPLASAVSVDPMEARVFMFVPQFNAES